MKYFLLLFLTATALALSGGSTAKAQLLTGVSDDVIVVSRGSGGSTDSEARNEAKSAEKTPATVPLPEAKRRCQEKERQLRELADGKADIFRHDVELITDQRLAHFDVSVVDRRDQVRQAVAEAYDARQQLQAAELAELERRIASIKRAMALRETMKDSIIDQRTDELLEQMEAAENQPKQQSPQGDAAPKSNQSSSQSQTPGYPRPAGKTQADPFGAATQSANDPHLVSETQRQLLELDVQEAEATLAAAERAYKRGKALHDTGVINEDTFDKLSEDLERAKIQCERAKVKLKAVSATPSAETKPSATAIDQLRKVPVMVDGRLEERIERKKKPEEGKPGEANPNNGTSGGPATDAEKSAAEKPAPDKPGNQAQTPDDPAASNAKPNDGESKTAKRQRLQREHQTQIRQLDVQAARAHLDKAGRAYKRFDELLATGAIEQAVFDEAAAKYKHAQIKFERAKLELEAFVKAHHPDRGEDNQSAEADEADTETKQRLAALEVDEDEASLAEAEIRYERFKRLYDSNSIQKSLLDEQADNYKRAQIQLERAKAKLKALSPDSTSALDLTQGKQVAAANANDSLTITLIEAGDGKPAAVYLADGKVGDPLPGTPAEQDDQIRHAVEQGVSAGKSGVLIKAEKGVAHRDVSRVSAVAGSVEGVSLHLAVAESSTRPKPENVP